MLDLANRVLRPAFDGREVDDIVVREDADWAGDPSLFVDVFLTPKTPALNDEGAVKAMRAFSRELLAAGEERFPYIRLRDRSGEGPETAVDRKG